MGWRETLHAWEVADLQALEIQLRAGYNETLEAERRKIIARAQRRAGRRRRGYT